MSADASQKYQEQVQRLLNEILAELKESNVLLKEHDSRADKINQRVRKIGFNTANW